MGTLSEQPEGTATLCSGTAWPERILVKCRSPESAAGEAQGPALRSPGAPFSLPLLAGEATVFL